MVDNNHILTNHDEIREWAKKHKAEPAVVSGEADPHLNGTLRLNFPGENDERDIEGVTPISWDEFFTQFEEHKLAISYEDGNSRVPYRFVDRYAVNPNPNVDLSTVGLDYET